MAISNPILDQVPDSLQQPGVPAFVASEPIIVSEDNPVLEASQASAIQNIYTEQGIKSNTAKTENLQKTVNKANQKISLAEQVIALQKSNATLQRQLNDELVLDAAGGTEAQASMMGVLTAAISEVSELDSRKADIMDDEPTGLAFFDAIINELRSVGVDTELESATDRVDRASSDITRVTQAQESFHRANVINKKNITEGTIAAETTRIASLAIVQANEAEKETLAANSAQLVLFSKMKSQAVNQALQQKQLESQNKNQLWLSEQRDMQDQTLEIQTLAANRYYKSVGLPELTEGQVDFRIKNDREGMLTVLRMGAVPSEQIMYGNDVAVSQRNGRLGDPEGLGIKNDTSVFLDAEEQEQWNEWLASPKGAPKDQEERDGVYVARINKQLSTWKRKIVQGDHSNLYHAPRSMEAVTGNVAIQESALWNTVPQIQAMKEFNTQAFYNSALAGVVAKSLSVEDAAQGIVELHKAAALHNSTLDGGFIRYGMEAQSTYNLGVELPANAFQSAIQSAKATGAFAGRASGIGTDPKPPSSNTKVINHMSYTEVVSMLNLYRTRMPKEEGS